MKLYIWKTFRLSHVLHILSIILPDLHCCHLPVSICNRFSGPFACRIRQQNAKWVCPLDRKKSQQVWQDKYLSLLRSFKHRVKSYNLQPFIENIDVSISVKHFTEGWIVHNKSFIHRCQHTLFLFIVRFSLLATWPCLLMYPINASCLTWLLHIVLHNVIQ